MVDVGKLCKVRLRLFLSPVFKNISKQQYSTAKEPELPVRIPERIKRGPTDILKALELTVKRDPTASHYKFPDDPFFEVNTSFLKRSLALSIEAGRTSARWIVKNNPEYFKEILSDPYVKSYAPPVEYNENSDVGEKELLQAIHERNISSALTIYDLLKGQSVELSEETKQSLLELICYYNGKSGPDENELESKWYTSDRQRSGNNWVANGVAEQLFASMNQDCPKALSALIQGMLKYGEVNKAVELYNDAKNKNILLSCGVYNGLISSVRNIVEENRWEYITNILREMNSNKIKPNIFTLNAVMEILNLDIDIPDRETKAEDIISEFKRVNVHPSLATYFHWISVILYYKKYRGYNYFKKSLMNILQVLNNKLLVIQHPHDTLFFPFVMRTIATEIRSSELAHELHKILLQGNNYNFIVGNLEESDYYKSYLLVTLRNDPVDVFMDLYRSLVPNVFIPTSYNLKAFLDIVQRFEKFRALPLLWIDIENCPKNARDDLSHNVLSLVETYMWDDQQVSELFLKVAKTIYSQSLREEHGQQFLLTDQTISNILITYFKLGKVEEGAKVVQTVEESGNFIDLNAPALTVLFDYYLTNGTSKELLNCLKKAKENFHPDIKEMAEKLLPLLSDAEESDRQWVKDLSEGKGKKIRERNNDENME